MKSPNSMFVLDIPIEMKTTFPPALGFPEPSRGRIELAALMPALR
jgi:hypothetical protein